MTTEQIDSQNPLVLEEDETLDDLMPEIAAELLRVPLATDAAAAKSLRLIGDQLRHIGSGNVPPTREVPVPAYIDQQGVEKYTPLVLWLPNEVAESAHGLIVQITTTASEDIDAEVIDLYKEAISDDAEVIEAF